MKTDCFNKFDKENSFGSGRVVWIPAGHPENQTGDIQPQRASLISGAFAIIEWRVASDAYTVTMIVGPVYLYRL